MDDIQEKKWVLGPFLGFPGETIEEVLDFRLRRLEEPRCDGDVDFSEPSIQRKSIQNFF